MSATQVRNTRQPSFDEVRDLVSRTMAEAIALSELQLQFDAQLQTADTLTAIDVIEVETIEAAA